MRITKEIAYRYLTDKGTMSRYTQDFYIVDIYTEPNRPGVNGHPVIICEYKENKETKNKYIHVDLSKFSDWVRTNRQNLLDELLK